MFSGLPEYSTLKFTSCELCHSPIRNYCYLAQVIWMGGTSGGGGDGYQEARQEKPRER